MRDANVSTHRETELGGPREAQLNGKREIMFRNKKLSITSIAALTATAAIAATTWGPYLMVNFFPSINYTEDSEAFFGYSQKLPRQYLNYKVQDIQKGDNVRIVYPNGEVYDFETQFRCSATASPSCSFINPVKKASATSPANLTSYDNRLRDHERCPWDPKYIDVATGYWSNNVVAIETGIEHTAKWIATGTERIYYKTGGGGCK